MATKKSSTSTAAPKTETLQSVYIVGSVTPAVGILKRGEKALVAHTANVDDLVSKGFIDILKDYSPVTPPIGEVPPDVDPPVDPEVPPEPEPKVPNPDVDNGLVDITDPGTDAPVDPPVDPEVPTAR